jgi:hypothetical protein
MDLYIVNGLPRNGYPSDVLRTFKSVRIGTVPLTHASFHLLQRIVFMLDQPILHFAFYRFDMIDSAPQQYRAEVHCAFLGVDSFLASC